jgi:protein ImuB
MRTLMVWCPDWPVLAAELIEGVPAHQPVAVLHANRVLACSPAARDEGVRRNLRKREAQGRCPELVVVEHDPARDTRAFEPVVAAVEEIAPSVTVIRPGACAVAARGPARYFGSEERAAERIVEHIAEQCGVESQIGIADGMFAAELAARAGRIVPSGSTADFLAGVDISTLDRPALVDLLRRLGIRTLGQFAALPNGDVLARFGFDAALAHRLAAGDDERPLAPRQPPADLSVTAHYEEPLERVDMAAFAGRALAEQLHDLLARHGVAATRLGIEAVTAHGEELSRTWRHDGLLTSAAIAERVRWQLDGWLHHRSTSSSRNRAASIGTSETHDSPTFDGNDPDFGGPVIGGGSGSGGGSGGSGGGGVVEPAGIGIRGTIGGSGSTAAPIGAAGPTAGIIRLRLVPDGIVAYSGLQPGLWGQAGEERDRAHRALTRVQGLLGPESVVTAVLGGGRSPADRMRWVPWTDEPIPALPPDRPWPGQLPAPAPAVVLPVPEPAAVYDARGELVTVTARLTVTAAPARLSVNGGTVDITGWAGPWPVDERWWDGDQAHRAARFQVSLADGGAVLLELAAGLWRLVARYD